MHSHSRGIRRPLTDEELGSAYMGRNKLGVEDLNDLVQKISLERFALEERREEAKKPLYITRV